ncbi:hypothetical protein FOZ62_012837, partial [Perkinsus olseni]
KPESAGNCIDLVITRKQQVNMIEKMQIKKPQFITTDHKIVTARIGLHLNHNYLGKKPRKFQASWLEDASTRPRLLESLDQEMAKLLKEKRDDMVKSDLDTAWRTFKNSLLNSSHSSRSNAGYRERSNNLRPGVRPSRARMRQERRSAFRKAVGDIKNSSLYNQRSIWTILRRELDVKGCKTAIPDHLRAEDFATYMQKLYSAENVTVSHSDEDVRDKSYPSSSSTTPAGPDHIADYADCNLDPLPLPEPITFDEVHHAASRLKKGRSPGVDGISSDLIRQSEVLQRWVYELCSKCFEVESQPSEWLRSKVTLIKKAGKPPNE